VEAVSGIGLICRCVWLVVCSCVALHLVPSARLTRVRAHLVPFGLCSYDGFADNFACPVETMPQRYGDTLGGARGRFPWDFRRFRPDAVVSD
jgi:hypothetical protein